MSNTVDVHSVVYVKDDFTSGLRFTTDKAIVEKVEEISSQESDNHCKIRWTVGTAEGEIGKETEDAAKSRMEFDGGAAETGYGLTSSGCKCIMLSFNSAIWY